MSMQDIKKALLEEDYCEAMKEIGYKILYFDEDGFVCIFENDARTNLVYFEVEEREFWTYSKANHGILDEQEGQQ